MKRERLLGVVSWTERIERESEWMKKCEGGCIGTKCNCVTEHERHKWADEQTKQERVWSNIQNRDTNPVSFLRKDDLSQEFWRGDGNFVMEFFNFKPAIDESNQRLNRNRRETDRIYSQSKTNGRRVVPWEPEHFLHKSPESYSTKLLIIKLAIVISCFWFSSVFDTHRLTLENFIPYMATKSLQFIPFKWFSDGYVSYFLNISSNEYDIVKYHPQKHWQDRNIFYHRIKLNDHNQVETFSPFACSQSLTHVIQSHTTLSEGVMMCERWRST